MPRAKIICIYTYITFHLCVHPLDSKEIKAISFSVYYSELFHLRLDERIAKYRFLQTCLALHYPQGKK